MAKAETQLITPRRNFLVRALGFTAAGATLSIPITTLADARSRMAHHADGLRQAMEDYYGKACRGMAAMARRFMARLRQVS